MAEEPQIMTLLNGRAQYLPIKLTREWMGHPSGSRMQLIRSQAENLESRGTAKILVSPVSKAIVKVERKKRKIVASPPKDKMVKGAEKTK